MARYTGPRHKLCRAEGIALCGLPKCPVTKKNAGPPGQHGARIRRKISEYGIQLREKQKVKRIYGILERQFKKYFQTASRKKTATGEALLQILESRLDNIIYRLNLAASRPQARQLVSHGHVLVNDKKVTIPSFSVKIGDVIALDTKIASSPLTQKLNEVSKDSILPGWLEKRATVGRVKSLPNREDIDMDINERLIVEYYSR